MQITGIFLLNLQPRSTDERSTDDALPSSGDYFMSQIEGESRGDRRRLRITLVVAMIFHVALLFFTLPEFGREPQFVGQAKTVYVMQQVRFEKPPAPPEQQRQEIPDPKTKRIPIPDPTPDEPEPLRIEDMEVPDLEPTLDADEVFFGIPDAPDPGYYGQSGDFTGDALQVGDGIQAPVKVEWQQPRYTEEARQARIQGVVILSCVIDEEGNVRNLKAVKGLGLGLTESALEEVATWKYKPAVNQRGEPVPVHYNITIGFWLQ